MKYEWFLPFDDYQLGTPMSEGDVRVAISGILETNRPPLFSFKSRNTKPYRGRLTKEGFEISRVINYRNSFLPQIRGRIVPSGKGSTVHVSMRPHLFGLIFMSFWLGVVGLVCVGILVSLLTQWGDTGEGAFSLPLLIPFVMFVAGYGMLTGGYRLESKRSKGFLAELLRGYEEVEENP